jgi:hypothetical protein
VRPHRNQTQSVRVGDSEGTEPQWRGVSWHGRRKKTRSLRLANEALLIGADVLLDNDGTEHKKESNDAGQDSAIVEEDARR